MAFFKTFTVYQFFSPQNTTENWQVFTDKIHNVSFSTPSNAKTNVIGSDPKSATIMSVINSPKKSTAEQNTNLIFYVTPRADVNIKTYSQVAQETREGNVANCPKESTITPLTKTKIGNYDGVGFQIKNCNGNFDEYFLANEKTVFELSIFSKTPFAANTERLREQVISSFSFN